MIQIDFHRPGQIGKILWPQFGNHIVAQIDDGRRFGHVQGYMGQMGIGTLNELEVLQAEAVARATGLQDMVAASWYICKTIFISLFSSEYIDLCYAH